MPVTLNTRAPFEFEAPSMAHEAPHALGTMSMFDILWTLEELRRELASKERDYYYDMAKLEGALERDARGREVATYRTVLAKFLNVGSILFNTGTAITGFGSANNADLRSYTKVLQALNAGLDSVKSIDNSADQGNRAEAGAVAQFSGELRRQAEEAKRRDFQEIAEALNQLLKILTDHGHLFDQMVR